MSITSAQAPVLGTTLPTNRVILRPKTGWQPVDLKELWRYRELFWILALRDVKVRYKQTFLGVAWAIIQPLLSTIIFVLIFTRLAKLPTDNIPPAVFYFSGMLPWLLFSTALGNAGNSLITNQNLISKVYFPRLVIPAAAVITGLIDFAISLAVLAVMMLFFHTHVSHTLLLMPIFVALAFFAALGIGLWLSALNVEYRDVRYVIPFLTQFWFWITPVVIPTSMVTGTWKRALCGLNPMTGVVEGFRWCLFGSQTTNANGATVSSIPAPGPMLLVSTLMIVVMLITGLFYFRRMEKTFADRL